MHKKVLQLLAVSIFMAPSTHAFAIENNTNNEKPIVSSEQQIQPVNPFTGKITKNKVRVRLQPSVDSSIVKELLKDSLLIVTGEADDFYAIKPTHDLKAYVFRTYVLDNVVEGNRVNVRLEPTLESPVVAQLNSGDRVDGIISPLNSKWLEISLPEATRFFIAKEYVEKVGDVNYLANLERRREEVNKLLNTTYLASQSELQKPYQDVDLDPSFDNLNKIIHSYTDFPEQVTRARELLALLQDSYLQKKISYLESKANSPTQAPAPSSKEVQLLSEIQEKKQEFEKLEQLQNPVPQEESQLASSQAVQHNNSIPLSRLSVWKPIEEKLYEEWLQEHHQGAIDDFYAKQQESAVLIKGFVEPYTRNIKNKPGDYVLLNSNRTPVAYLYSTHVDLQNYAGTGAEVTVIGASRSNNHFAFPAYFVLSVQE